MKRWNIIFIALLSTTIFGGADAKAEPNEGCVDLEGFVGPGSSENVLQLNHFYEQICPGISNGWDVWDSPANIAHQGRSTAHTDVDGTAAWSEYKPADTNHPFRIKVVYNGTVIEGSEPNTWLEISFPFAPDYIFGDRSMILQQVDSNGVDKPNGYRGDARAEIDYGGGLASIPFGKLPAGTYAPDTPFLHLRLDFDKLLADLNNDGVVDFKDYAIAANYWKKEGMHISDISGPNDVPDLIVDNYDLARMASDWLKEEE